MSTSNPNIVDAPQKQVKDTYDYIVVGSGSAGSVVAGELRRLARTYCSSKPEA